MNRTTTELSVPLKYKQKRVVTGLLISAPSPRHFSQQSDCSKGFQARLLLVGFLDTSERLTSPVTVQLVAKGIDWKGFSPGDMIAARVRLQTINDFKTPGSFSFRNYWLIKKIAIKAYVDSPIEIIRYQEQYRISWFRHPLLRLRLLTEQLRHRIQMDLHEILKESNTASLAIALLTGDRGWIPHRIKDEIYASGIGHLLAISGLHMAMVFGMVYFFSYRILVRSSFLCNRINVRLLASMLGAISCFGYCSLAGYSPSALRAFIMVTVLVVTMVLYRPASRLNILAVAAWVILALNPLYLLDVSFQLSFCAVFFLLLFLECPLEFSEWRTGFPNRPLMLLLITLVAWSATAPIAIHHFQRANILSIPLNLVAVPLVEFITLPMLLFSLLLPSGSVFMFVKTGLVKIGALLGLEPILFLCSQEFTTRAAVRTVSLETWQITILYALFISVFFFWSRGRSFRTVSIGIFFTLFLVFATGVLHPYFWRTNFAQDSPVIIHILDVGDGLSQVLEMPDGSLVVMDGGGSRGSFPIGRFVVSPFIRQLGYRKIDTIIVSHPHDDHVKGILDLVEDFPIKNVFINREPFYSRNYEKLREMCKQYGIRMTTVNSDTFLHFGTATLHLIPCSADWCEQVSGRLINSRALVVKLENGKGAAIFSSDIYVDREADLIEQYGSSLQSDLLIVPHHGSNTSSSNPFISTVKPYYGVISVGKGRPERNLPSSEVIRRYEKADVQILRTDLFGTITLRLSINGEIRVCSMGTGKTIIKSNF